MKFTSVIKKGEKQYVALCPKLDVVSQGYTKEEALTNLKEAIKLYTEEMAYANSLTIAIILSWSSCLIVVFVAESTDSNSNFVFGFKSII